MKRLIAVLALSLLSLPLLAQTASPAKYILDLTVGFDRYDHPRFKGGVGFAFPITDPTMTNAGTMEHNTFDSISYDVTSKYTTTIDELVRVIYRHPSQRMQLFTLVGAGVTTGNGAVAAAFDGGAGLKFAPFKKTPDFGIIGAVRVKQLNGLGTYFAPTFGVSYTLR
jgi:hypothetical protein